MAEKRSFFGKIKDFFGNLFKPEDDPIARGPINPPISKEEREQAFESLMAAVKENPSAIQYAYPTMQKDPDVFRTAFGFDGGPKPLENPSALLMAAQKDAAAIKIAPNEFKKSKAFAIKATELNGMSLEHLGAFKTDKDVVGKAIHQNPQAIQFARTDNKDVALEVLKVDGKQLRNMSNLQNDYEAVMTATSQNGMALQFASNEMRENQDIVKNAVRENGMALQFSGDVKDEKKIALIAAEKNPQSMKFMSQEMRADPEVFEKAFGVRAEGNPWNDKETILKAIEKNDFAVDMVPDSLKSDREFVKSAVEKNGDALKWLPKYQEDKEIVNIAKGDTKPKTMDEVFEKYLPKNHDTKNQNGQEKSVEKITESKNR